MHACRRWRLNCSANIILQDVIEALTQDYPQRHKSAAIEAWSDATKLASRIKAIALLWVIYFVALPLSLWLFFLRAAVAWLLRRPFAAEEANHDGQPTNGHGAGGKIRGTALVSGEQLSMRETQKNVMHTAVSHAALKFS